MKIVIVSGFYSVGMGYSENSLPKSLALLGHDVHIITSNLNVYSNMSDYGKTYEPFLGIADQGTGQFTIDGYTVHRLSSNLVAGYVYIKGLYKKLKELRPDIVQSTEVASLNTFKIVLLKPLLKFKLFTETHQHLSIIKTYLKNKRISNLHKRLIYRLTRTLPSYLASLSIEKCYAITPDCAKVATQYYGVSQDKIKIQPLGTDTVLFHPVETNDEAVNAQQKRRKLGFDDDSIICIYTGRFSKDKNPLLLAQALAEPVLTKEKYVGLFIGEGIQKNDISKHNNVIVLPFMKHVDLAEYYQIADIAVWPLQESMSMLDAAASGLPLIVSDKIGEYERINGNGKTYSENDHNSLAKAIASLSDDKLRSEMGRKGRNKMIENYSWKRIAEELEKDYLIALSK